jgi:hypothetical protein
MHYKQHFYMKNIHIKLLWKNNSLRCKIYNFNYENNDLYLYYNDDQLLIPELSELRPHNELRCSKLNRKLFTLSQEITIEDFMSKNFYFNFHIKDKSKNDLIINGSKKPFLQTLRIHFGKKQEDKNDFFHLKIR